MRETHRLLVMPAERRGSTTDRTEGETLIEESIFTLETLEQSENFSACGEDDPALPKTAVNIIQEPLVEDEISLKVPTPAQNERRGIEYLTWNFRTMYIITLLIFIFVIIFFYVYVLFISVKNHS